MPTPMLATLADRPFDAKGWLFEIKWDGYRALALKDKTVHLVSRNEKSFNERFGSLVKELAKIPGRFLVDGEIVMLDSKGRSQFQLLQNYDPEKIIYYLFDILSLNGKDLTGLPLGERKKILRRLLSRSKSTKIRFSEHIEEKGIAFFRKMAKQGEEGIVAKKIDSPYRFSRSRDWLKIKARQRQEAVICGFTPPKGSRPYFGALLLGVYDSGKLIYIGRVGGGFNRRELADLYQELLALKVKKCPFSKEPFKAFWVKPKLVCEIEFAGWTKENILRQPIFKGLRSDKSAKEVVRECPIHPS